MRQVVAGSAPGSVKSAQSALRWWAADSDVALGANGNHLPPTAEGLASWSRLFKSAATFSNYVGYLRLGSQMLGLDVSASYGPMVRRAKEALRKGQKPPRAKMFLREATVAALLGNAVSQGNVAAGMLYLAAYVFLLRVPSELLPAVVGADGDALSPLAAGFTHAWLSVGTNSSCD